jgi:squalene synthase HpnC
MLAQTSELNQRREPRARDAMAENFPVASKLLAHHVRGPVLAFYRFARAADDVADDPELDSDEKLRRLDRFESGLDGRADAPEALALRAQIGPDAPGLRHAAALINAFRMDATGRYYPTWSDLCDYCASSANPVGRFLLDVHGEPELAATQTDPLCTALQVLNHLQDIAEDKLRLDRVYLPQDWLDAEGVTRADLSRSTATPQLRRVIDRALTACDDLLAQASGLPQALHDPGLRAQSRATLWLAEALASALRRNDPLASRVAPSRSQVAAAVARAALWRVSGR